MNIQLKPDRAFSPARVYAMVLRYLYLYRGSWPRILDLIYWPAVQMILWGFITQFLVTQTTYLAQAFGLLIAAVLLWDVLFRSQLGVSLMFFEEIYARNLGHLFISPLRPYEMVLAMLTMSMLRTLVGVGGASLLAIMLYHYSLFSMGLPLLAFFANLLAMGWAMGLIIVSIVMIHGMGAESLAWVVIFAVAPVSGVYYPISVLPGWLQPISWSLPSSYVFEGMREVMRHQRFDWDLFVGATLLNGLYLSLGVTVFLLAFRHARRKGLLLSIGE